MKSFYEFYRKMLQEVGPGMAANAPGTPNPIAQQGQQPMQPMQPTNGGATSPPVPPPDPNIAKAMQFLGQVKDPNAQKMISQFQKQMMGAGFAGQIGVKPDQQSPSPQSPPQTQQPGQNPQNMQQAQNPAPQQ